MLPDKSGEELAESAARQIRVAPQNIEYIEARGLLCHELLYLLGGRIRFVETPWSSLSLKILEFILPIAPICRWAPPDDCELQLVGRHHQSDLKVYRLVPNQGPMTVFFIEYKPEVPSGGCVRPLFNVPRLDIRQFLRPPFERGNSNLKTEQLLRSGSEQRFGPILMTAEAREQNEERHLEMCRGMWQGFSRDSRD